MAKKKTPLIVGNWKMYKTIEEAEEFVSSLVQATEGSTAKIGLAVPFTAIRSCSIQAKGKQIEIGAQNMNDVTEGAFTGEIASKMLKEAGATFVILGHSERRRLFNEESGFINRKVQRALTDGLKVVLCVGESLEEREEGRANEVVKSELFDSLAGLQRSDFKHIAIAYEPVWAIGTGVTATPEQAEEMHAFCRTCLEEKWGKTVAKETPILYGGSVTPEVALELMNQKSIGGLLVGGASLSVEKFSQIIHYDDLVPAK